jgi:hypothetical protein
MTKRLWEIPNRDWIIPLHVQVSRDTPNGVMLSESELNAECDKYVTDLEIALHEGGPERLRAIVSELRDGLDRIHDWFPEVVEGLEDHEAQIEGFERIQELFGPNTQLIDIGKLELENVEGERKDWIIFIKNWFSEWSMFGPEAVNVFELSTVKETLDREKKRLLLGQEEADITKDLYTIAWIRQAKGTQLLWEHSVGKPDPLYSKRIEIATHPQKSKKHAPMQERYALAYLAFLMNEEGKGVDIAQLSSEGIDHSIREILGVPEIPAESPGRQVRERLLKDKDTSSVPRLFNSLKEYFLDAQDYQKERLKRYQKIFARNSRH